MDESDLYNQLGKRQPDLGDFQWLDLKRAAEETPKPRDFVLPGLKAGTVGALVSSGGTGKSMLALQAAVTVAGGADTLDLAGLDRSWNRVTGRVVFLSAEDPSEVLNDRFHALAKHLSEHERVAVFKNLAVAPLCDRDADLMALEWRNWFSEVTAGARLVVLDTLRRLHHLDENKGEQMAQLMAYMGRLCRESATTVLFLHHTNKSSSLNNGDAQQASRGSSVLTDNARFQANLVSMTAEQAKERGLNDDCRFSLVRLSFSKISYSPPLPEQWFRRGNGGVLEPAMFGLHNRAKGSSAYEG